VYGYGFVPSRVAVALPCVALKKFLNAVSPAIDFAESSVPTHLPACVVAIEPP
jgi:hypothetical protein